MIEILAAPDNVVAMKATGTLDADDYDRVIALVEDKLKSHPEIGLVADVQGLHAMTPEALWKDLQYGFRRIGQWHRFPRCALVTDEGWLKALAGFWDPILPQIEMRVFAPGETARAIEWAAES